VSTALQVSAGATVTLSWAAKAGTLDQLRLNARRVRSGLVPVLSWPRETLYLLSYAAWVVYGAFSHDAVVAVTQSLGVVGSLAVLGQFARHRHLPHEERVSSYSRYVD
jgi:hypothetical protein